MTAPEIGLDAVSDHFTLNSEQLAALRNKTGATRLGFAVMWCYLVWRGRFPRGSGEIPADALAHVAVQVGVPAPDLGEYDLAGRQASSHRAEIRRHTGYRPCTVADADKLAAWVATGPAQTERRAEPVRELLLAHCHRERIEPPAPARLVRIVDSGIRQAEHAQIALIASRLDPGHVTRLNHLVGLGTEPGAHLNAALDTDLADDEIGDEAAEPDVLSLIKASPGNVSLASMLTEISKLEATRGIDLPAGQFTGIDAKVITAWRARAAIGSPSHLHAHQPATRLVLLAALMHQRQREITDTLVELLNSVIHKINAYADKAVTEAFVRHYKRTRNTGTLLGQVAEASLQAPDDPVRQVIYPVLGGTAGLTDLLHEYKARQGVYGRDKRHMFRSSYSNHYRAGLIKLLGTLQFRSNNTAHQPVLDGLQLILRYAEAKTTYYPTGEHIVLDGVVRPDWTEFALATDKRGRTRVVRQVYECCVLIALRERLRCKEIWVVGADAWRNPDDDLPADFDDNRAQHYQQLRLPYEARAFTTALQTELHAELDALHQALPDSPWVQIQAHRLAGAIKLTWLDRQPEPQNLRRLKSAIRDRWGTVPLRLRHQQRAAHRSRRRARAHRGRPALRRPPLPDPSRAQSRRHHDRRRDLRRATPGDLGRWDHHRGVRLHPLLRLRPQRVHRMALPVRQPRCAGLLERRVRRHGHPLFEAGSPAQMGGYAHAADNPVTNADPTGLACSPGNPYGCPGHDPGDPAPAPAPAPGPGPGPGPGSPGPGGGGSGSSSGGGSGGYDPYACARFSAGCGGARQSLADPAGAQDLSFLAGIGASLAGAADAGMCGADPLQCLYGLLAGHTVTGDYTTAIPAPGSAPPAAATVAAHGPAPSCSPASAAQPQQAQKAERM